MGRAEASLDQSQPGAEPGWVSYVDANELAGEWTHCFRDIGQNAQAQRFANQAIELAGPLDSARYHQYLTDFQANIARAYGREHLVDEFTNTVRQRYPSLSLVGDR